MNGKIWISRGTSHDTQISSLLLERAGIQLEPETPEGMAVA